MSSFGIDPGRPAVDGEHDELVDDVGEGGWTSRPSAAAPGAPAVVDDGWLPETVGDVFAGFGAIANGLARMRGGGPDDVFIPTEDDRAAIGRPLARYLNRHEALRRFAEKGDLASAGLAFAGYLSRETGRAAAYREAHAELTEDLAAESPTASGVGIRPGGREERPSADRRPGRSIFTDRDVDVER